MNYLVLDVGGSAIKFALMNDKVEFLEKGQVKTPKESIEEFTETIGRIFYKYLNFNKYNFVRPEVVRCKYRNDSNLIGALYHYLTNNF